MRTKKKVEDLSFLTAVIKDGKSWKQFEYDLANIYFDIVNGETK